MIYLKRFLYAILFILWTTIIGLLTVILCILGLMPSIVIAYTITGYADNGPTFLMDLGEKVLSWIERFEPKNK